MQKGVSRILGRVLRVHRAAGYRATCTLIIHHAAHLEFVQCSTTNYIFNVFCDVEFYLLLLLIFFSKDLFYFIGK